jgi:hypothetical protein
MIFMDRENIHVAHPNIKKYAELCLISASLLVSTGRELKPSAFSQTILLPSLFGFASVR